MKKKCLGKGIVAIILSIVMVLGMIPIDIFTTNVKAASEEVTKTYSLSTYVRADDMLSFSMTDPDDNTSKTVFAADGDNYTHMIRKFGSGIQVGNTLSYDDSPNVRFWVLPNVNGKVTKIEFTKACRVAGQVIVGDHDAWPPTWEDTSFFMSIDGMKYNGTDEALTGESHLDERGNTTESENFTFISTDPEGIEGNLSLWLGKRSMFTMLSGCEIKIHYIPAAEPAHEHDFTYSMNGNTLTATCGHSDGRSCSLADSNHQISVSLEAEDAYYQFGYVYPATLLNNSLFASETGATIGNITYRNNTTGEDLGTQKPTGSGEHPTGAGDYTASVTINVGGTTYTLTKDYALSNLFTINNSYPQFSIGTEKYSVTNRAAENETVTLTFTPQYGETLNSLSVKGETTNYSLGNGITKVDDTHYTFLMPAEEVNISEATFGIDENDFVQDGDTYTIKNADGWNYFCLLTNYDTTLDGFNGKTVKLDKDIEVSTMAGTSNHPFKGMFDGQNHTLTFNLTASEDYSAPFHYTDGGTIIINLHVQGTITGGDNTSLGGLVGKATGNITIDNCHVSTQISTTYSGSAWHGGVIAAWNGTISTCTVTGCVYDGLIYNPDEAGVTVSCRGFIGWDYGNNGTITFTDCLSAPAAYGTGKYALGDNCFTFVYPNSEPTLTYNMTNCYYTTALGNRQGRPATTAPTAPYNLGNATTDHGLVEGYENGFLYNGNYYTPKYGDAVVEYRFDEWNERADVTINGEGDNLVGINIDEEVINVKSVTYNCTFTVGVAATVILPFSYICDGNEGGKFYSFAGVKNNEYNPIFEPIIEDANQVTALEANTPYIYVPTNSSMTFPNITNMTDGVVTLKATAGNHTVTSGDWTLMGIYVPQTWMGDIGKEFILDDNGMLDNLTSGTSLLPTHGYFICKIHDHNFTYTASTDGKTITATCTADDCSLTDKKATLTINVPLHTTYGDGNTAEARLSGDTAVLGTPVITYTGNGDTAYAASTTAPIDAGSYIASITLGSGDNSATASISYTIEKADTSYTVPTDLTATYGQTLSEISLPEGWTWTDGTISVGNVGNNTFKASFTPSDSNYKTVSDIDVTVAVGAKSITGATVTLSAAQIEYTGSERSVSVTGVTLDDVALTTNDYEVTNGTTGIEKNTYTVTVTGKGNYKDTATATWAITDKPMTVTVENVSVTYDGSEHDIFVNVSDPATGYTIKYGNSADNCNLDVCPVITNVSESPKTVYFVIAAANYADYTGSATITINPKTVNNPTITLTDGTYAYNGSEIKPAVAKVSDGTAEISSDEYTVSYSGNVNAGTATVTITDKTGGNYTVSGSTTFTISPLIATLAWSDTNLTYNGNEQIPTATVSNLVSGDTCMVTVTGGKTNAGTYTATATALTNTNYTLPALNTGEFTIARADNVPGAPTAVMDNISVNCKKVSDVTLPEGWIWSSSDKDKALITGTAVTATAVYDGADKENYNNITVSISITRSTCSHSNTETVNIVTATCTDDGYSGDVRCKDCGEIIETGHIVNATDHKYGTPVYTWSEDNKTCTAVKSCMNDDCTEKVTETVNTLVVTIPSTCENKGSTTYTATFTKEGFVKQTKTVEIPAVSHEYGTPVYKWSDDNKTCTATKSCTKDGCDDTITETVNATVTTTAATCEKTGSTTYSAIFSKEGFTKQTKTVEIPATGHKYGTPEYKWSDDNKTCTATATCINDGCSEKVTETANATSVVKMEPTSSKKGVTRYTAVFKNAEMFSTQTNDVEDIPEKQETIIRPDPIPEPTQSYEPTTTPIPESTPEPTPIVTKNEDGSTTEITTKENTDGSTTKTETTTGADGNVLKTVEETVTISKKGTVTVQTTTETADGTKIESTEKTTKAGKVVTETTETKADGSTTYTKETKNTDGSVTVDLINTEADNTVVITKEKVNDDGLKETDVYFVEVASKGSGKKKAGKVELISVIAKSKVEVIPDTIKADGKTYKVVHIGENVFAGNKKVRKLTIGKYVTSIGENAFANDKNLKDIQIYGNIKKIGKGAFSGIAKKAVITIHADEKTFEKIVKRIKASGVSKKVKFVRAD
ncbi:MAG: leucine-rich repeat protein [Lachnospiraceae bacterium]|nr:leucine-rich repeat protein [Lachnospiraceae bacterium]